MTEQDGPISTIDALHAQIRACRKCEADGFPIAPPPLVWGEAPAPFLLIGQAPGLSDWRGDRMYLGPAARKLISWLAQAGFADTDIGTLVYMTALTKCFPGRLPGKSTDRAPSPKERANCRPWLNAQWELVSPQVVILFGKMALDTFLPRKTLDEAVGRTFAQDGVTYVPLPHSSGASTWLNYPAHQDLLAQAIDQLRAERTRLQQEGPHPAIRGPHPAPVGATLSRSALADPEGAGEGKTILSEPSPVPTGEGGAQQLVAKRRVRASSDPMSTTQLKENT